MKRYVMLMLAMALGSSAALAQTGTFPDRPLRIVVPFAAGGNVDIVTRIVAGGLSETLGQSVVVENKAGANGVIGAESVARSAADGYTLFIATAETMALNPFLMKTLPYDPLKDFAAIGLMDDFPFTLTVNPQLPVKTVADFVAYARANDGKLNFSSWGTGSIGQIAFEQFKQATGIRMEHIPFKGRRRPSWRLPRARCRPSWRRCRWRVPRRRAVGSRSLPSRPPSVIPLRRIFRPCERWGSMW